MRLDRDRGIFCAAEEIADLAVENFIEMRDKTASRKFRVKKKLDHAFRVQVGGNETEAKDRLVHAKRFGARKIVVVSKIESLKRLKEICRYEPDLKNWLEIWSVAKIYRMYLAGQQFFELFRPFEKQQWSPEIREMT